jgi:hypothetical protein
MVCSSGWEYSTDGKCEKMPSTNMLNVHIQSLPCFEQEGMVWIWPRDDPPKATIPSLLPPSGFTCSLLMQGVHGLGGGWRLGSSMEASSSCSTTRHSSSPWASAPLQVLHIIGREDRVQIDDARRLHRRAVTPAAVRINEGIFFCTGPGYYPMTWWKGPLSRNATIVTLKIISHLTFDYSTR